MKRLLLRLNSESHALKNRVMFDEHTHRHIGIQCKVFTFHFLPKGCGHTKEMKTIDLNVIFFSSQTCFRLIAEQIQPLKHVDLFTDPNFYNVPLDSQCSISTEMIAESKLYSKQCSVKRLITCDLREKRKNSSPPECHWIDPSAAESGEPPACVTTAPKEKAARHKNA